MKSFVQLVSCLHTFRILEACGTLMGAIETEEEFLLAVKCRPVIDMVIMREEPEKPGSRSVVFLKVIKVQIGVGFLWTVSSFFPT